jgi:uncharacterized protein YlbG (UPF0298 family)
MVYLIVNKEKWMINKTGAITYRTTLKKAKLYVMRFERAFPNTKGKYGIFSINKKEVKKYMKND